MTPTIPDNNNNNNNNVSRLHNRQPIEWDNIFQVRSLLQDEIINAICRDTRVSSLANACKLCPGTISKLAYGETKEPRANTVLVLLKHFGYRVTIH